ncbi:MAG TPA: hypothetical protein VG652_04805 [Gaiellaceae bacterium]|nr:hypothetical protein [Gaiellaceae bacterium]
MKHPLWLLVLVGALLVLAAAALVPRGFAKPAGTPFYAVAPPKSRQCNNVKGCQLVVGPWVTVPANGEATFVLDCPKRHGSVGGSDSEVTSKHVHVWFDAQISAPIAQGTTTGPFLLFHAVTDNGKPGAFEPLLGCIALEYPSSIRSTVSARVAGALPGTTSGVPLQPRARLVVLNAGSTQHTTMSCGPGEKLIGSWSALAFVTSERHSIVALLTPPPNLSHDGAVTTKTVLAGRKVVATIQTDKSLPFNPLAEVQVGALCVP